MESWSWTFLSYVVGDECAITRWYDDLPLRARVKFDARLTFMKATAMWPKAYYDTLKGKTLRGLGEIRFTAENVQYRRSGREFVMLIGCTHKQQVYDPPSALSTAAERMKRVQDEQAEVREYESECEKEA